MANDPSTSPLPAGTVTFLLTDVEGSSRLWETEPGVAFEGLARLQEMVQDSTRRHGGELPLEQGEGDSSVSVFARASDAAACAVDIQRANEGEPWSGPAIRVRIAMHTGEAERRADGTYRGGALNRCARLRDLGHGGQILASQATYELLIDRLDKGLELRDLGAHRLRDLSRPEHVWQLCGSDLAEEFPPLRSQGAAANKLPVELTSFVGREGEIGSIGELLSENRLVTLVGAGGCGKTRLALRVASGIAEDYPDGVWWVDLAPLADASLVPSALAGVLGVRESPVEPITDTVVGYLAGRQALVGLDNCEHLIEACAALASRLVRGCPSVTVMATSREPLRVDGEVTHPVPPMSLPTASTPESLAVCESARLFLDRARGTQPSLSVTEQNASSIAEICTRLDGIPLAIELAAARTRVLTVEEISTGLANRFHLLTGGARSALPRQRTLEASVDWSHGMLDDDERAVFRRLAAFAGSFTLDAAEAVCAADGVASEKVLDLLDSLVGRSLVQVVDEGRLTRYRLLETMRDYGRRKLNDAGEAEATRERHLDFYVSLGVRAAAGMEGPDLIGWLARVDTELDNLRAALDWSPRSVDPRRGQRLVGLLTLYWHARSELSMGRDRLEVIAQGAAGEGRDRAQALTALCMICYRAGDMVQARAHADEAVDIARRLDDPSTLGRALHWRAYVRYWGEGDRFAAWADFDEAAELLRSSGDRVFEALNLALIGFSYMTTGEAPRARAPATEALRLAGADTLPHARCIALLVLGHIESFDAAFEDAEDHLEEALALAQEIGDPYAEIIVRAILGLGAAWHGRYREGRDLCERGLATALEHRSPNSEAFMRAALGYLAFAEGHLDAAAAEAARSYEIIAPIMPMGAATCRGIQAEVAVAQSRLGDARLFASEAVALGRNTDTTGALVWGLEAQASLARLEGDAHSAEDLLHEALDVAERSGFRAAMGELLDGLAGAVAQQGRFQEADRLLGATHALRLAIGSPRFAAHELSCEADRAVVREGMGAEAFEQAWNEGAAMTLDDALAYARRGRGKRGRPTAGWNSLTPTEARIVDLVAEGLTNPQIGEKLFVSARTVQTHLTHVFAKLGISTRAELAAKTSERQVRAPSTWRDR